MPWRGSSAIQPFSAALDYVSSDTADEVLSQGAYIALLAVASFCSLVFVGLFYTVANRFSANLPYNASMLRVLRAVGGLSATVLFLPFSSILMRSVVCGEQPTAPVVLLSDDLAILAADQAEQTVNTKIYDVWMGTDLQCGGAVHILIAIAAILLLVLFSVLAVLFAATVVDRSPSSRSLSAKVHGRGDVALLLMKLLLSGLFNIGSGPFIGSAALAVTLLASGAFWFWLSFSYNLYVHPLMNALEVAAASAYTWCCLALLMARSAPSQDYAAFIYLGGPVIAVAGFLLSKFYQQSVAEASLRDLTSLSSIEMWARARLSKFAKAVIELSIDGGGDEDETRRAYQAVLRSAEDIQEQETARREMITRYRVEAIAYHAAQTAQARAVLGQAPGQGTLGPQVAAGTPPLEITGVAGVHAGPSPVPGVGGIYSSAALGHRGHRRGSDASAAGAQPMPPSPSAHGPGRQRRMSLGSPIGPAALRSSPQGDSTGFSRKLSKEKLGGLLQTWRKSAKRLSAQRQEEMDVAYEDTTAVFYHLQEYEGMMNQTIALLAADAAQVSVESAFGEGGSLGTAPTATGGGGRISGVDAIAATVAAGGPLDARSRAILAAVEHAKEAERAYRYLLTKYPRSALAGVLAAAFWRQFGPMQLQEAYIIAQVLRVQPAFDLQFYCLQRTKQLSDGESGRPLEEFGDAGAAGGFGRRGGSSTALSVVDSILQQQNMSQVQSLQTDALRGLAALWDGLAQRTPDLAQVLHTGEQLMHILQRIDVLYLQMLKMYPDSIQLLRSYGSFLTNLNGQRARAVEYLNRAERLESAKTTQHMDESYMAFVMGQIRDTDELEMDERGATITISASRRNTGEVVNVSAAATRLLGLSSERFKGMNIGAIVPQPIRSALPRLMDAFVTSGIGGHQRYILGPSRMALVSRASKPILTPVWVRIREAPVAPDTGEPRLFVYLHEILTSDQIIVFEGARSRYRIRGGTRYSLAMLGIESSQVEREKLCMTKYFPSLQLAGRDRAGDGGLSATVRPLGSRSRGKKGKKGKARIKVSRKAAKRLASMPSMIHFKYSMESVQGEPDESTEDERGGATRYPGGGGRKRGFDSRGGDTDEVELPAMPLLSCHEPSLVPMKTSTGDLVTVVGSVQEVSTPGVEPFYVLRWLRTETFISQHHYRFAVDADSIAGGTTPRGFGESFVTDYSVAHSFHHRSPNHAMGKRTSSSDSHRMATIRERPGAVAAESSSLGSDLRRLDDETQGSLSDGASREGRGSGHALTVGAAAAQAWKQQEKHREGMSYPESQSSTTALELDGDSKQDASHWQYSRPPFLAVPSQGEGDRADHESRERLHASRSGLDEEEKGGMLAPTFSNSKLYVVKGRKYSMGGLGNSAGTGSDGPAATTATGSFIDSGFGRGGSIEEITRSVEQTYDPSDAPYRPPPPSNSGRQVLQGKVPPPRPTALRDGVEDHVPLHAVPTRMAIDRLRSTSTDAGVALQPPAGILSNSRQRFNSSSEDHPAGLPYDISPMQSRAKAARTVQMAPKVQVRQMRDDNDFGERKSALGSVSSGGSSRLSSQLSRAMQLQEGLVEPEVGKARCLVWSLVAFILVAAVASIVWSLEEGRATLRTAEGLYLSGQRVVKFESAVAWIESISFYNDREALGLDSLQATQVFGHPNRTVELLLYDAQKYAQVQKDLSANADLYGPRSLDLLNSMESSIVEVAEPISFGNLTATRRRLSADHGIYYQLRRSLASLGSGTNQEIRVTNISLSQAGSYVATKLFLIADLPRDYILLVDRQVAGLLLSLKSILNGMYLYTEALKADLLWRFPRQRNIMTGFGSGVFLLVVVLVGGSFALQVQQIKSRTDANAQGLLIIPHSVTKMLHKRAQAILNRRLMEESGLDEEEAEEAEAQETAVVFADVTNGSAHGSESDADSSTAGILAPDTSGKGKGGRSPGLAVRSKSYREILMEGLMEGKAEQSKGRGQAGGGAAAGGVLEGDLTGVEDEEGYVELEEIAESAAKWHRHQLRRRRDTFKPRSYLDSGRFLQTSVINLLVPVLLVGVWAGAIVAYILVLASNTERSSLQMSLTEQLYSEVEALGIDVLDIMTVSDPVRDPILEDIRRLDSKLKYDLGALVYGGDITAVGGDTYAIGRLTKRQEPSAYSILYENGCRNIDPTLLASTTSRVGYEDEQADAELTVVGQCREIENDVMTEGAFFGAMAWLQVLQESVAGVPPDSDAINQPLLRVATERVSSDLRRLLDLERPHLRSALASTAEAFRARKTAILEEWILVVTIVAAAFGALFFLVALFWYEPSVHSLANPIRAARTLLRLLPLEIVDSLPPVRVHLKAAMLELQMLKQDSFGGQTAAAAQKLRNGEMKTSRRKLTRGDSEIDINGGDGCWSRCCCCFSNGGGVRNERYRSRTESLRDTDSIGSSVESLGEGKVKPADVGSRMLGGRMA